MIQISSAELEQWEEKKVCRGCSRSLWLADPLVLQFDHRPGEARVKDIGWFISSGRRVGLLVAELAKSDVRCANCHRRRTAEERSWFRARTAGD